MAPGCFEVENTESVLLNYLLNFPLQRIKIDRALIQNVDVSLGAQAIAAVF